jgi:threonyl-tRNA synthetase
MWQKAESALAHALAHRGITYQINQGEGAFYGPKIDYHIEDSLGRLWQCGTIQVDFSMPERFELEYIGSDGNKHRPVMIHRAIFGSLERFIGILIEHVAGAFPLWLAPVQCILIPISEKFKPDALAVCNKLIEQGIRAKLDDRNEKVGYKIRDAETKKIPYMGIIGEREAATQTVSIRKRKEGDLGPRPLAEWIAQLQEDISRRVNH